MHAEQLERRRLFATVTIGLPGFYEVWGTEGDDVIEIGIDQVAETFALDGETYGGVLYVVVHAGGGNDAVTIGDSGRGSIAASIRGGEGQDNLTLHMDGAVWGEGEQDTISLRDSFRGEAYGGDGDDYISVSGDCIDARLEGNEGDDVIWAIDNNYSVVLFGHAGNDRLFGSPYADVIFDGPGRDFIFGLGDNDEIHSRDGEHDWIMGGDGSDILFCDPTEGGIHSVENVFFG
jgi:Ca2+-binding RTX toxin-like protein